MSRRQFRSSMLDRSLLTPILAVMTLATTAAAQYGGPLPEKPGPVPINQEPVWPEADLQAWAEAYEVTGRPRILVLAGWSNNDLQSDDLGGSLLDIDTSGMVVQLRAAFIDTINAPPSGVFVVDAEATRAALQRLSNALALNNERAAVQLLANDLSAELVVLIELLSYDGRRDAPGRVLARAVDASTGRALWTLPFAWKGDASAGNIKLYGEQLAVRFIDEYAARALHPESTIIHLVGLDADPRAVRAVQAILQSLPGVIGVTDRGISSTDSAMPGAQSLGGFAVRHRSTPLDLQADLIMALTDVAPVAARIIQSGGDSAVLLLQPRRPLDAPPPPVRDRWSQDTELPPREPMETQDAGSGGAAPQHVLVITSADGLAPAWASDLAQAIEKAGADCGVGVTIMQAGAAEDAQAMELHITSDCRADRLLPVLREAVGELPMLVTLEHFDQARLELRIEPRPR